tara:strand:+ start:366 stop:2789 length:2424 start_codon:yes stop_codon:yes gene_type:complete
MIKLFIGGQEVDLNQNEINVTIDYSIENIDLGNISGAHSKRNVILPATKTNVNIFQNITDAGAIVTNAYKLLPARLEADGVPILTGKARLEGADLQSINSGFLASSFKVSLIGNNADWFADVGNILVRDLGWDDIEINTANVKTNYDPLTSEHCFILMKWKAWANETYIVNNEMTPAIFIWQILEKAFSNKGYQLNSIFKTDPFNRLIIPMGLELGADYLKDFVNLRASNPSPGLFSNFELSPVLITFTDETTSPNFDTGGNYSSGVYTVPITATYTLKAELNILITFYTPAPTSELLVGWEINGVFEEGEDLSQEADFDDSVNIEFLTDLVEGDLVRFVVIHNNAAFNMYLNGSIDIIGSNAIFEAGRTFDLQYVIPISWYVRDVIADLTTVFNLAWETNVQSKQVYAYPKDDYTLRYRADATGAISLTTFEGFFKGSDKYDLNTRDLEGSEFQILDGYKSSQVLAYATDDDTTNKEEERRGVNIYSGGYNFPTDRFDNGVEFIYTKFFAKAIHISDVDITSGGIYGAQMPLVFGDDYNTVTDAEPNYNLAPRLLYYAGRRNGLDGYIRLYDDASSAASAFDFPAAFMVNYNDPSGGDFNLSFSDEVTNFTNVMQGIFKTFHLQTYKRIELGKVYTTFAKLKPKDITQLSFRRKGIIGSSNFIIQSIEYNPKSNSPAKTVLLYDEKPNVNDLTKVSNTITLAGSTPQSGTVTGSGSGLVGANGATVNIQLSYTPFLNSMTNVLVLAPNSGITQVSNTNANVLVFQNGQKLIPTVQYIIGGSTIGINVDTHYDGANYEVVVNGVTKG